MERKRINSLRSLSVPRGETKEKIAHSPKEGREAGPRWSSESERQAMNAKSQGKLVRIPGRAVSSGRAFDSNRQAQLLYGNSV